MQNTPCCNSLSLFFYARRRAARGRSPPDAVLRPFDFFAPLFPPSESEPPFHGTKTGFPTELPRQVFCWPEQHSILLPFCLPAVQKSLSLLSIINFYPHASCLQLPHPLFGPAQIVGMPFFRNPVRTKLPAGRSSSLLFILFFSEFICQRLLHPLFGTRSNRRHAAFSESRSDKVSR